MITNISPEDQKTIEKALQSLSGVCDGARSLDGAGFNKMDAYTGLILANKSLVGPLSEMETLKALSMMQKYRKQLEGMGIILPQPVTVGKAPIIKISHVGDKLFVYFTNVPDQATRQAMKGIAGWKWNPDLPDKPWSFPATKQSADSLVILFSQKATWDEEPETLSDPQPQPAFNPSTFALNLPDGTHQPIQPQQVSPVKLVLADDGTILVYFNSKAAFLKSGHIVKGLPERRWNPDLDGKPWVVPNRFAQELIEKLSDASIDPQITDLVKTHQELAGMSRKAASDFDVPGMKLPLLPYQRAGVEFIEKSHGRAIIADEMGLGKTAEALAYLQLHQDIRPAIIVVPASLKINWQREIDKFMTSRERVYILSGTKAYDLDLMGGSIYIINYDVLASWKEKLIKAKPAIVIFDEAHLMKNSRPKGKKEDHQRKGSQRGNAGVDLAASAERVLCLTGTPIVNRPIELFPLLNMVAPEAWANRWRFIQTYCDPNSNGYGTDYNGASNLDDLHNRIKPWFVRREKSQVLTELPEKRRATMIVEFDKEMGSDYHAVMIGMKQVIADSQASHNPSNVLAQIERAKQATCAGKLPACVDWIRNFLDTNGKLVVFATHQFTIDKLMETFGDRAVAVTGEVTGQARQNAVDSFQNDPKIRLLVGNVKAAGVGLTLTAASDVAFIEYPWTPGDLEQAADRVHRVGQKNAVTIWYLVANETIEEDIVELLQSKAEILGQVHDGKPVDLQINIYDELIARIKAGSDKEQTKHQKFQGMECAGNSGEGLEWSPK